MSISRRPLVKNIGKKISQKVFQSGKVSKGLDMLSGIMILMVRDRMEVENADKYYGEESSGRGRN